MNKAILIKHLSLDTSNCNKNLVRKSNVFYN